MATNVNDDELAKLRVSRISDALKILYKENPHSDTFMSLSEIFNNKTNQDLSTAINTPNSTKTFLLSSRNDDNFLKKMELGLELISPQ